jgi:hypothetical protein
VDLRFPRRSRQGPELRAVLDDLQRQDVSADLEQFARFQEQREDLGDWGDALLFSRGALRVTPEELLAFFEEYLALLKRYARPDEDMPADARVVLARFVAFPAVDPPADREPD